MTDNIFTKEVFILILVLITTFVGFGTKIWFWSMKPFNKLLDKSKQIDESSIDLSDHKVIKICTLREFEKCGKKIIVAQFIVSQATKYSRRAWEECLKIWGWSAMLCLYSLSNIVKSLPQNVSLAYVINKILNATTSTIISVSFLSYLLSLFYEYWLIKSQIDELEDVL